MASRSPPERTRVQHKMHLDGQAFLKIAGPPWSFRPGPSPNGGPDTKADQFVDEFVERAQHIRIGLWGSPISPTKGKEKPNLLKYSSGATTADVGLHEPRGPPICRLMGIIDGDMPKRIAGRNKRHIQRARLKPFWNLYKIFRSHVGSSAAQT